MSKTSRSAIPWAADSVRAPDSSITPMTPPSAPQTTCSTPENLLVNGDIVLVKSSTGMYFGPSTTQMRHVPRGEPSMPSLLSEEGRDKFVNVGGATLQISRRPTLTAAVSSAVPMVVASVTTYGPTALKTGDVFTLRAMDPDLSNHTFLTTEELSYMGNVGGGLVYTKVSDDWPPSAWIIGWSVSSGEEANKPVILGEQYILTSTYTTGQLTHRTTEPLFQGSNLAIIDPLFGEGKPTTWSFKRLGRLLAVK